MQISTPVTTVNRLLALRKLTARNVTSGESSSLDRRGRRSTDDWYMTTVSPCSRKSCFVFNIILVGTLA